MVSKFPPTMKVLLTIWCYIPNFNLGNGSFECRQGFGQPFFAGLCYYLSNGGIKILVLYNAKKHFTVFLLWHISDPEQSAVIFQV